MKSSLLIYRALAPAAALLCLATAPPAVAQNNSLLHRRGGGAVPTTQPAGGARVTPVGAGPGSVRGALQAERPVQHQNATLLAISPFAVVPPEPESIEVNDLVTVIVRVSKEANSKSNMESKKDWTHEWELAKWIRLTGKRDIVPATFPQGNPAVSFEMKNDYAGDGKYDRSDSLTTRVQAKVIDVKPNGTIVLEARNDVSFGEEDYSVTLTGMCRAEDVTPDNTVLSSQVADLRVEVVDRGAVRDATRRGWLMRGFDLLRPF